MKTLGMAMVALVGPMLTSAVLTFAWVYRSAASEPKPAGAVSFEDIDPATEAAGAHGGDFIVGAPAYRRFEGETVAANGWTWQGRIQSDVFILSRGGFWPREDLDFHTDGPGHGRLTVKPAHEGLAGLSVEVRRAP